MRAPRGHLVINDVFGANAEAADGADGVLERAHRQVDVGDLCNVCVHNMMSDNGTRVRRAIR